MYSLSCIRVITYVHIKSGNMREQGLSGKLTRIPDFLEQHKFALTSDPCSTEVRRVHADASAALSAIATHGGAVALSATLLQLIKDKLGGNTNRRLPLLRAKLLHALEEGTRTNVAQRDLLRVRVTRVIFADGAWPKQYLEQANELSRFANRLVHTMAEQSWRMRRLLKTVKQVIHSICQDHETEPLENRVWGLVDGTLSNALCKSSLQSNCDLEVSCTLLPSVINRLLKNLQVKISVGAFSGPCKHVMNTETHHLRCGVCLRASMQVRRLSKPGNVTQLLTEVSNVGCISVLACGVHLQRLGKHSITDISAILPYRYATASSEAESTFPTVSYATTLPSNMDELRTDQGLTALWDFQIVNSSHIFPQQLE